MKVCIIGTGYVGLVTGTCLAEMGNDVICVDTNPEKIEMLLQGKVPIYEPGLEELIRTNTQEGRLSFTTHLKDGLDDALICMIAVGTPQGEDGSADLTYVLDAAREVALAMDHYMVIVTKSTVPVGTSNKIRDVMSLCTEHAFSVVSNPEFLKQGNAVEDFLKPDRVIIGCHEGDNRGAEIMKELYDPFLRTGNPVLLMSIRSAEMTKYAANAFLATKISFINEMSGLCEKVGADIEEVRVGISSDKRIGSQFLFPGLGYGGSCFPKDVRALIRIGQENDHGSMLLEAVDEINLRQRNRFLDKIFAYFGNTLAGRTFAVWGLAFKPKTDDMREAPSITIIEALLKAGAKIQAFDPKAMETAQREFQGRITTCKHAYDVLQNADALLLLTEWNEFRRPDYEKVKSMLKQPLVFDGRNQYDPDRMAERGFQYISIGRLPVPAPAAVETPATAPAIPAASPMPVGV